VRGDEAELCPIPSGHRSKRQKNATEENIEANGNALTKVLFHKKLAALSWETMSALAPLSLIHLAIRCRGAMVLEKHRSTLVLREKPRPTWIQWMDFSADRRWPDLL
jgi:hypothetical protein